jgi:PKD repeat protein
MKKYSIITILSHIYTEIQSAKKLVPYIFISALVLFNISCTKKEASTPVPVAGFLYSSTPTVGSPVIFTNKSTDATTYLWDFGDPASGVNNTSTETNPQHTFSEEKDYIVYLTATGPGGTNTYNANLQITACQPQLVEVGNSIDVPTTWDPCHIYHCANFLGVNAALTIEAGTIVKFDAQKGMLVTSPGTLTVNGTAVKPVIFTSIKDDFYGGDNNGDGAATVPQKGDWQFITFGTSSGNSLNFCKILYAGSGTVGLEQALNMGDGENNSIKNSVIAHTAGGINQTFAALNMAWCPLSCVAQNNTFFDNGHPVIIGISTNFDNSNVFHNPDNTAQTNAANGIFVDCVHSQDQAPGMTWSETEVAYVLGGWSGNSWAMDVGKVLVLGDNVVLKFATHIPTPGFSLLLPDGEIQLQNHGGPGVVFTSYNDDSEKGDTNGDGPSTGSAGYWEGIFTAGPTWFDWGNIHYAAH